MRPTEIRTPEQLADFVRDACDHLECEPMDFFFLSYSRVNPDADAHLATNMEDDELAALLAGLAGGLVAKSQSDHKNSLN
jgi:hypothetical protein